MPLLAGFNRDEGYFLSNGMTADKWKADSTNAGKIKAADFLKLYPGSTDTEAIRSAIDYGSDLHRFGHLELARSRTAVPATRISTAS